MQPAEHVRKNSKTFLLPVLSYVHRKTKEELRYGDIKMRKVKSTDKTLNNITSKWWKFYFQWETNCSLENAKLIPHFQHQNICIKNVMVSFLGPVIYNPIYIPTAMTRKLLSKKGKISVILQLKISKIQLEISKPPMFIHVALVSMSCKFGTIIHISGDST